MVTSMCNDSYQIHTFSCRAKLQNRGSLNEAFQAKQEH